DLTSSLSVSRRSSSSKNPPRSEYPYTSTVSATINKKPMTVSRLTGDIAGFQQLDCMVHSPEGFSAGQWPPATSMGRIMAVLASSTKSEGPADFEAAAVAERAPARAKMPRKPAPNVAELSARLFAAYTIEGGSVRLAGCTLEPVTIVHVKARPTEA